jgi:DNA-directed RNA polymerase specialized sigma24 family protein
MRQVTQDTPTPAELRAAAEERLLDPGARRIRVLAELEQIDEELRPLVVSARLNEVSLRRVSKVTGLSTNTITSWVRRAEQESQDN